jgi:hypothetical protein
MLWNKLCPYSRNQFTCCSPPPITSECGLIWRQGLCRSNYVNMSSTGNMLIQCYYSPYNRTHTHKECHMNMKAEIRVTYLRAHERGLNKFSPHRPAKEPTLPKPMWLLKHIWMKTENLCQKICLTNNSQLIS